MYREKIFRKQDLTFLSPNLSFIKSKFGYAKKKKGMLRIRWVIKTGYKMPLLQEISINMYPAFCVLNAYV